MAPDDLKARFAEELKLRPAPNRYLDRRRERELLRLAFPQLIPIHLARTALLTICTANGYVVESAILRNLRKVLQTEVASKTFVTEEAFRRAIFAAMRSGRGQLSPGQCHRLAIALIEEQQWTCKQGFFRRWYDRARKMAQFP